MAPPRSVPPASAPAPSATHPCPCLCLPSRVAPPTGSALPCLATGSALLTRPPALCYRRLSTSGCGLVSMGHGFTILWLWDWGWQMGYLEGSYGDDFCARMDMVSRLRPWLCGSWHGWLQCA